ncbi:MAG: ABC transporter permease [Pseudomonadota bacterium]
MSSDVSELFREPGRPAPATLLRQHGYAARDALREFTRRPVDSVLTVFVLAVAIALPMGLWVIAQSFERTTNAWADRSEFTVFLTPAATLETAETFARTWRRAPGVTSTDVISPSDAAADLTRLLNLDQLPVDAVGVLPFVIVVELNDRLGNKERLREQLAGSKHVEQVTLDEQWLGKLEAMATLGSSVATVLMVLLGIGALVITGNTLGLGVARRHGEIEVLSVLGATTHFIRRPFIYQGALLGFVAGVVAYLFVVGLLLWLRGPVQQLADAWAIPVELGTPALSTGQGIAILAALVGALTARIAVKPPPFLSPE